jgi:hypothetical protein
VLLEWGQNWHWIDDCGAFVGHREAQRMALERGFDWVAYRLPAWPVGSGVLLEGDDWLSRVPPEYPGVVGVQLGGQALRRTA